jgi:hypothetical protein
MWTCRGSYTVAGWRCVEDERLVGAIKGTNRKGFIICIQHDKVPSYKKNQFDQCEWVSNMKSII